MSKGRVIVAGLGEIGKPLFDLISQTQDAVGVDISPVDVSGPIDVLHICYPFQIKDFVGETARYIALYKPALTVVNSTVAIGTTREIADRTRSAVVNSPVRGKHIRMLEDLQFYAKFVGAMTARAGQQAAEHFESIGLRTKVLPSPEATELAKLTETTYFGMMIAWAQEVERYCDLTGQKYEQVISFYDEIKFFPPVKYFPGVIGGHCVMPNIKLLCNFHESDLLSAIESSNQMKIERESRTRERMVASAAKVA